MKSPEQTNMEGGESSMKILMSKELTQAIEMAEVLALISVREDREKGVDVPGFPGTKIGTESAMTAEGGSLIAVMEVTNEQLFIYQL